MVAGNVPLYTYVDIPYRLQLESSFTTLTMSSLINLILYSLKKIMRFFQK